MAIARHSERCSVPPPFGAADSNRTEAARRLKINKRSDPTSCGFSKSAADRPNAFKSPRIHSEQPQTTQQLPNRFKRETTTEFKPPASAPPVARRSPAIRSEPKAVEGNPSERIEPDPFRAPLARSIHSTRRLAAQPFCSSPSDSL